MLGCHKINGEIPGIIISMSDNTTPSSTADANLQHAATPQPVQAQVPEEPEKPWPTVAFTDPAVQTWMSEWTHAMYARQPLPVLPDEYAVPPAAASVFFMDQFNDKLQELVAQYPEEHRKNQLIPVLLLTRAVVAWQETFKPSRDDWLNFRTNLGYYQQQHETQWREQFEGTRPSALLWLSRLNEAANYEATDIQLTRIGKSLKMSDNGTSRFWTMATSMWSKLAVAHPPTSISDNLALCDASIHAALEVQRHLLDSPDMFNVDALPSVAMTKDTLDLPVPVRDYHKGWDHFIRTSGRAFALEQAKSHYPDGLPNDVNDRVAHLKLIDQYYNLYERAFEPWRWDGLADATPEEQAKTWAWLTSWAPEYHWDATVKAMGIYPPVEAVGREYTGQSTQWWLTAPYEEKVQAALAWVEGANRDMQASREQHCNIDGFINGMYGRD